MVENSPLITTIIPTFQRPKLLERAIHSALRQTYGNIQVVIFDNNSQDDTANIVRNIALRDNRVVYFCHPFTIKASENFSFAFSKITTPYFSVLADDDLLLPNFYETALAALKNHPSALFFLGSTIDVDTKGHIIGANAGRWKKEFYSPPEGLFEVISNYFNWTGSLFNTDVLNYCLIDPEVKPIDFDFVARLAARFSFAISHTPCALFISHPNSYSNVNKFKLIWPSLVKIASNIENDLHKKHAKKMHELMKIKLKQELIKILVYSVIDNQDRESENIYSILKGEFGISRKISLICLCKKYKLMNYVLRMALKIYQMRKLPIKLRHNKQISSFVKS